MADFGAGPIDSALARKLDAFTVPALPDGFAARAAAAAPALPFDDAVPQPSLRQRRPIPRRWLRNGLGGLGVIAAGMLSISAAAMGYFGEPMREAVGRAPVIGKVIERVIPERLRHRERPAPLAAKPAARPVARAAANQTAAALATPIPLGPTRRRFASPEERRAWIEAHPEAAARIAERRRAWIEAHPVKAARMVRRRAWIKAHPEQAAQIAERRRAWREAHPEAAARRMERRARLRQWRAAREVR